MPHRGPDIEAQVQPSESPATVSARITPEIDREAVQVTATSFLALFSVVALALWGLPFYRSLWPAPADVRQFGWSRAEVTSGNALSKVVSRTRGMLDILRFCLA